jgi:hypothetical protein
MDDRRRFAERLLRRFDQRLKLAIPSNNLARKRKTARKGGFRQY